MNKPVKITILAAITIIAMLACSCGSPWQTITDTCPFTWSPFVGFPFGLIGLGIYFLPTIFAAVRRSRHLVGIILLNVLAGWTFVGWVIALVWSLIGQKQ
jgi:hypothetical protein